MEDLRRAAVEQEQLHKLCEMKAQLENIDSPVLDQGKLDSLGVIIGHPLDIDGFWDSGPRFFQPWVPHELLTQAAADCSGTWEGKIVSRYSLAEWSYGHAKAQWFNGCLQYLYEIDTELWEPWV